MSAVHFQEPPTLGRISVRTNKGNLSVELWSTECPKACRNFVQLCMEGYYDGTIFHRIIPGFIIQGGDPTGTGDGGDSIYGESFPDEFHSRLRFRYRGILGVANAGKGTNTNGSQFFITLDKQESLTGLHTMFGKVVGDSIYTLSDLVENIELDSSDRPTGPNPPRIISTDVIDNPFPDIVPRVRKNQSVAETAPKKPKIVPRRGGALSFKPADSTEHVESEPKPKPSPPPAMQQGQPVAVPPSVAESQSSDKLLSEIEKLQMKIKAAQAAKSQALKPVPTKRSHIEIEKDPDALLEMKFKTWTKSLHAAKKQIVTKTSGDESASAESSGWLNSVGSLKFAVDSKTAFSKDTSHQ